MIYVKIHQAGTDALVAYDGMTQETVEALLQGKDYEFIDQATYETELASRQQKQP